MVADATRTLRNAGLLMVQRVLHVVAAALFAVLVPRALGPAQFGRYSLLVSVSLWFALLSGLGAVSMMTRSVPRMTAADDHEGLRRLATSLIALRAVTGLMTAGVFFIVAMLVLREPDPAAAAFVAGALFCRAVGNFGFALFLGLNDAARWGMGDLVRRWATLVFVPIGFAAYGLRGACLGLLGAEAVVLACGMWWARRYLSWSAVDLSRRHLAPFLRMGTLFAAGNFFLALTQRSGETLVRFSTQRYEEVGYFGAAYAIYLTLAHPMWQLTVALAPYLITQLEQGRREEVARWLERLLKYLVAAALICVAGAVVLGRDVVPIVLGAQYGPVAPNLVPLMLTLVALAVGSTGRLLALTLDRPRALIAAAALEFVAFWAIGVPLALRAGSSGACLAALPASALYAVYVTIRVRPGLPYSLTPASRAVAASLVFVPLALLQVRWPANAALFAAGVAVYLALLLRLGVITAPEMAELRRLAGNGGAQWRSRS